MVVEVAEVEEDIVNCEELLEREFVLFILRPEYVSRTNTYKVQQEYVILKLCVNHTICRH